MVNNCYLINIPLETSEIVGRLACFYY